jgi:2-polyprenyl-6-methoxyphenol hydroxylase-like FAD-dependent oxidoreductase
LIEAEVLIVGAGPVGLTLALELARHGVSVVIAERRAADELPSVKSNHVSARSMEIFRRLGLAARIRSLGLPDDYPNDCSFRTTFTGRELCRIEIPSRRERFTRKDGPDGWWPTPEPPHRVNQIYLEPLLFEAARSTPNIRILSRTLVETFAQSEREVTAAVCDLIQGKRYPIRTQFMVGCDGGRSGVRRGIGARLSGDAEIQRVQSTYIRAPDLLSLQVEKPAWASFSLNPRRCGNVYAIDGRETWLIHNYLHEDEHDFNAVDRDACIRTILGVPEDFRYQILSKEDWIGRRLIADKFRDRRVFLCGDASHIWVPYAGYGMNAGIADAANLAWLLGAHLAGWAPSAILDAYESERLPITDQVSRFAMAHALRMAAQRSSIPAEVEMEGAAGAAARSAIGRAAYELNVHQYCCGGLNFGYFYDASPIIAYDGAPHPAYTMYEFTPSTVPGCRLPHFERADGTSLYDALGAGYTLLRFDRSIEVSPLLAAAADRRVPLQLLDLEPGEGASLYEHGLVLCRPDQHVAWRANEVPQEPSWLIDLVRGAHGTANVESVRSSNR